MVMGPTPPGTGEMWEAISDTEANSTSPTSFPSGGRLIPTSMTVAPWFYHLFFNEEGAADRGDEDIGGAGDDREMFRLAMGNGDGGIAMGLFLHEDGCERLADDIAPSDDDDVFSFDSDIRLLSKRILIRVGGAGKESTLFAEEHFSHIHWMEAVDIFWRIDRGGHGFFDLMWREGELDEDPVDFGSRLRSIDLLE